ncbi:hypothetical protein PG996_007200 [Apiospora saccharicola]|uniref:Uncharacterized protein n=1 Tax=Apiospora saccharicola TaxID=335842 RepID=A0ABR1VDT9_9PEZI
MALCCGLIGGSKRSGPVQAVPPAAARPAQDGLRGVEFSPRHSFASSNGGGARPGALRPGQSGLEGVEFSPSPSFASSDGGGHRQGAIVHRRAEPHQPAPNPELVGYYAPLPSPELQAHSDPSQELRGFYEPQASGPLPARVQPQKSTYH